MADTRRSQSTLATNLPDNTSGLITPQDVRDLNISTHPEKTIQTGAQASIPGSGMLTGDLYLPNNGYYLHRYGGSAWVPWGPLFPMTDPSLASLNTWVNQGSSAVSSTKGGLAYTAAASASINVTAYVKTAPTPPYTVTAAFLPNHPLMGYFSAGLVWRQSSDDKMIVFGSGYNSYHGLVGYKMNTATSFNSTPVDLGWTQGGVSWVQFIDDNTDRKIKVSRDGQTWIQVFTETRTTFLTPNQIGIGSYVQNANYGVALTLLSWKEE